MRVYVYPSDRTGCGKFRMTWPAEALKAAGHDVHPIDPGSRWNMGVKLHEGEVIDAFCPDDADVIVLQRTSHDYMATCVRVLREKGVAVVVDMDDDLTSIHPANPAYDAKRPHHNWNNTKRACADATLVTVSSDALAKRYGRHGRVRVIRNYLPDEYYDLPRVDSANIIWPAAIHSHPNDPGTIGPALHRILGERPDIAFHSIGRERLADRVAKAFRIESVGMIDPVQTDEWPQLLANIGGIGIAPLADTRFNAAKSWLKPLELSAIGTPWVASPREEYELFHRETGVGVLAKSPGNWYRELKRLVDDASYRSEMSEKARSAAESYRLDDNAWRWLEAWEDALRIQRG